MARDPADTTTTSTARVLKALLASRRVATASPASEYGGVAERYLSGRDQAAPQPGGNGAAPAPPTARFVDRGGLVIKDLDLWLIFWGSAWASGPSPTTSEITDATKTMLGGTYLSGLAQYRGINGATFKGSIQVIDSDPPNPFSNSAITSMLHQQLGNGALPEPDEDPSILYCVILPPGVNSAEPGVVGEHSFYLYFDITDLGLPPDFDIARAHYAWVSNDGSLDSITTVLSHELVESCTDPNGDGIQGVPGTCDQGGWCEIGDICGWSEVRNGVRVQAYWSEADQACIVPGLPVAAALPSPDGSPTSGGATVALPLDTVAGLLPAQAARRPRSGLGARFAAGLLATVWLVPIIAAIVTVVAYVAPAPLPPSSGVLAVLAGTAIGLVAWVLLAAGYAPMARARSANGSSYADLEERLCRLDARLASVPASSRTSAYAEAVQHRDFIAAELQSSGLRWVEAVGYVALWNRMHRAEEALIEIEPRSQVLADALFDEWRIKDSTVDQSTELLADLELARQYLVTLRVADSAATPIRNETEARAVVGKVRYAIDDFRDKRRAGLVRARNLLMATMFITEYFAFALLALAVIDHAPATAIVAGIVFYLVGALVGLFNRLGQQVGAETMVEDYSLAGVRLVLTPTLSGLAAVGGVVLTGMLAMSGLVTLTQPSGGAAAPLNLPALADIFDLNKFRIGLPLAALFGSTPALLSRRLQSLTDQYKDDLKSTEPSSAAPSARH